MAARLCSFFLIVGFVCLGSGVSVAQVNDDPLGDIVAPDIQRRSIKESKIDTENWEAGIFVGVMNIEDFGTNAVYGGRFAYHITERLFAEFTGGTTEAGDTSLELFDGTILQLTDDERELTYYNATIGYNLFQGEVFLGKSTALNSSFYVLGGAGNTEFAGDNYFTYTLGVGSRLFVTDWVAIHGDVRAHSFEHELFGVERSIINLETHLGVTLFF